MVAQTVVDTDTARVASAVNVVPQASTVLEQTRRVMTRHMTPWRAVLLSLTLTGLAVLGDFVTAAEAAFTLFYVLPLAIAVWFVGLPMGYLITVLAVAAGAAVDVLASASSSSVQLVVWNNGAEAVLYLMFAHLLAALRARVDNEVKLRIAALDQLRHSERLTTVGKLAAGIAHEVGTPLNVISGHADLIATGSLEIEEVKRSLRVIRLQVERITFVVRQLLDFSRRAGGGPRRMDLSRLAAVAIDLLRPLSSNAKVQLVRTGSAVDATVNSSELQQVLANLITNAIHAMPQGGTIEVSTEGTMAVPPDQLGTTAKPYARLSVKDQGSGIAPEVLPCIFDPFFTTKEVGQGTGLGLSVSYGIIQDHGGWITVDTKLGEGTTFHIYIPR